jgi:gas vesicle protein
MDQNAKFVCFLAGMGVGASIALLFAPKSGRDTRRLIGKTARHGTEAVADAGRDIIDKGRELYEKGRKVADDAVELFERGRRLVEN